MSKAMLIALVAVLATPPVFAAKNVTVEQLSREVAPLGKTKDAKAAEHLYELQLTQRLSAKKLAAFEAALPGPDSRRALVAVADQAEFLDPRPDEIPSQPAPSVDQQRAIIAKSISYVEATLHGCRISMHNGTRFAMRMFPPGCGTRGRTRSCPMSRCIRSADRLQRCSTGTGKRLSRSKRRNRALPLQRRPAWSPLENLGRSFPCSRETYPKAI